MMAFRAVKANLTQILGDASGGQWDTVGYQRQVDAAKQVGDTGRSVQVFYQSSSFPESSSGYRSEVVHVATYGLELTIAASARGDINELLDTAETDEERAAALSAFRDAADLADEALDEFFDAIYQVIMDARNYDLGMQPGEIADRWITELRKDEPVPHGAQVILTGRATMTVRIAEDVLGEDGVPGELIDLGVLINEDDTPRSGVQIDYT